MSKRKNHTVGGQILTDTETYINNITKNTVIRPKSKGDLICAPNLKYEAGSCARIVVLHELAKAYNSTAKSNEQIKLSRNFEILNPQKYKSYLVSEIDKRIGDKCTTQKCWSKQDFIRNMDSIARNEFIKYTFRPKAPQGKFTWLNTININDVMAQYENKYHNFKFFGAVPMDFAELSNLEISNPNYSNIMKGGKTKLGTVFNLDNHNQSGSHWVAMYTDLEKGQIYYFDSVGIKPEKRVRTLMRDQCRFMKNNGIPYEKQIVDVNTVQHQKENTECGVYSMNFIIRMLRGDEFKSLCNKPISDKKINKCRKVYFNKHIK
jgi:hypothetical protein